MNKQSSHIWNTSVLQRETQLAMKIDVESLNVKRRKALMSVGGIKEHLTDRRGNLSQPWRLSVWARENTKGFSRECKEQKARIKNRHGLFGKSQGSWSIGSADCWGQAKEPSAWGLMWQPLKEREPWNPHLELETKENKVHLSIP